jgi:hypothetical protein
MIDTVNYQQRRFIIPKPKRSNDKLSWRMKNVDYGKSGLRIRIRTSDDDEYEKEAEKEGLTPRPEKEQSANSKICPEQEQIVEVEVSLPKLLFLGKNEKLIDTQDQITEALTKADQIVDRYCKPTSNPKEFTRVDLVWHFLSSPPARFFIAHQNCTHQEMRTRVFAFYEKNRLSGIEWQGGKTMHLKMYDKTNWGLLFPKQVVRVEIQLKWDRLRKKFNGNKQVPVYNLDIDKCYQQYRSVVLKLHPKNVPKIAGRDKAICHAEFKGVRVIDLIGHRLSNEQIKLLRKKAAAYSLNEFKIDWNALLPKNSLPPKHDAIADASFPKRMLHKFKFSNAKSKSPLKSRV